MLKGLSWAVLLLAAAYVGWSLSQPKEDRWATIETIDARWDPDRQVFVLRLIFTKLYECDDVVVWKHIVPVVAGQVNAMDPIPITGTLDEQIENIEVGTAELWDTARMVRSHNLQLHEEHILTMIASCEDPKLDLPAGSSATKPATTKIRGTGA